LADPANLVQRFSSRSYRSKAVWQITKRPPRVIASQCSKAIRRDQASFMIFGRASAWTIPSNFTQSAHHVSEL